MRDIRFHLGMLALAEIHIILAKLEEADWPALIIHAEHAARLVIDHLHSKQVHIKVAGLIDVGDVVNQMAHAKSLETLAVRSGNRGEVFGAIRFLGGWRGGSGKNPLRRADLNGGAARILDRP